MEKIVEVTQNLNIIFDKFNESLFDNKLEKPVICVAFDSKGKKMDIVLCKKCG
jgi:hypothetical protein